MTRKVLSGGDKLAKKLAGIANKLGKGGAVNAGFLDADNATIAFYNEYGTTQRGKQHIPPRPFLRQAVAENSAGWGEDLGDALKATDLDLGVSLKIVGRYMADDIQRAMRDITDPANADSTIKRKGFDNPLIGKTEDLYKAVNSEVVDQ